MTSEESYSMGACMDSVCIVHRQTNHLPFYFEVILEGKTSEFEMRNAMHKLQVFTIRDKSGNPLQLEVWDGDIGKFEVGKRYWIRHFWAKRYKSDLQISIGKHGIYGRIEDDSEKV